MMYKKTLKQLRGDMTQTAAAKKLSQIIGHEIPYRTLQRWESGESSNPTLDMIEALAVAYGVSEVNIIAAFRESRKTVALKKSHDV